MRVYTHEHAIGKAWPTAERLLVCISPGPDSARLVRAAQAYGRPARRAVDRRLRRDAPAAPAAGAKSAIGSRRHSAWPSSSAPRRSRLPGQKMSEAILGFAHDRNVTKIVVGKPRRRLWTRILIGSIVDALVQGSGDIDIYVISAEREPQSVPQSPLARRAIPSDWPPYGWAMAVVALATGAAWLTLPFFELANLVMVYLLGIVVVATRYGRGPSLIASILSVAALDFFFVPPVFTFAVSDVRYLFTFVVMLLVGLVISGLAARIRMQAEAARQREQRTAALYAMSRELASTRGLERAPRRSPCGTSARSFAARSSCCFPAPDGGSLASWAADSSRSIRTSSAWRSGCTSTTSRRGSARPPCPAPPRSICPCKRRAGPSGSSACGPPIGTRSIQPDQLHQLETFANQTALALERAHLADEAQQAAGAHRDRAPAQFAAQLGLARSAHAAGHHHGRGHHHARRRRAARHEDAPGAARVGARGSRSPQPPRCRICSR